MLSINPHHSARNFSFKEGDIRYKTLDRLSDEGKEIATNLCEASLDKLNTLSKNPADPNGPDKYRFSLTGLVKNSPIDPLAQPYDALMIMAETLEPDRKSAAKYISIKEYWGFGKVRKPSDITKIAEELLKDKYLNS